MFPQLHSKDVEEDDRKWAAVVAAIKRAGSAAMSKSLFPPEEQTETKYLRHIRLQEHFSMDEPVNTDEKW